MKRALLVLLIAACGKSNDSGGGKSGGGGEDFAPTARIDGSMIVVEARCKHGSFSVGSQHAYCEGDYGSGIRVTALRIPASTIGTGKQTITVKYEHKSTDSTSVDLTVDIPAAASGPFVSIEKCDEDFSATDRVHLDLTVDGKSKLSCSSFHGARAKLSIRATPGGKLAIGDTKIDVPATGEVEVVAELAPAILALKVDDFAVAGIGSKSPALELPYSLDAGGKQVAGKISFEQASYESGKLFRNWLEDIADGKIDRPVFTPPEAGKRKTIVYLDTHDIVALDRRGTVKEIAYVATMKETGRKEAGTCDFQSNGKTTSAKRFGVDSEVTVTSLADGKTVATKPFPAPSGCPMFAMLDPNKPETAVVVRKEDVTKWLETLAKP